MPARLRSLHPLILIFFSALPLLGQMPAPGVPAPPLPGQMPVPPAPAPTETITIDADAPARPFVSEVDDGGRDVARGSPPIHDNADAPLQLVAHLFGAGTF